MRRREMMASLLVLGLSWAICQPAAAGDWGTIRGKFVVDGDVSAPAKLEVTKDTQVCTAHHPVNEEVVVGAGNGLANVVVYLYSRSTPEIHPDYQAQADNQVAIDNLHCAFAPHVATLWTSQTLLLKNSDSVGHNSNITCIYNDSKNVLIPAGGEVPVKFEEKEKLPVAVACNIHPWMKGYVLIQDHPYMAVTKADGTFEIKNVPAGKQQLVFWHEKLAYLRGVKIGDGETSRKGRLKLKVASGDNDLGVVQIKAKDLAAG